MKYIYGPLHSRRLGRSLGLSLTASKVCNFDCVYCQLGRTKAKAGERKEYLSQDEIISELKAWFQSHPKEAKEINYITISGSGEPTLNIRIGGIISQIKKTTAIPIAVITNASLLSDAKLRRELSGAELILPSLDAATPEIFAMLDRPLQEINLDEIINGLVSLKKEFKGKVWLEVMLVAGINDSMEHIRKLKEVIDKINPDKVQLNSPVRSTAEPNIFALTQDKLKRFKQILGDRCEII